MPRLLLAGQSIELALPVLGLFHRAGFAIDYVSPSKRLEKHPYINRYSKIDSLELLPEYLAQRLSQEAYDQVVLTDDLSLAMVKNSNLPDSVKLQLLPITSLDYGEHLSSKIGLSKALKSGGIRTPEFRIIHDGEDLRRSCQELGYPLILKGDFSGGGTQTIRINQSHELDRLLSHFDYFPAILQRYIEGSLVGIEAFYHHQTLIFFNYAEILLNVSNQEFTPSVMRSYRIKGSRLDIVRSELEKLGLALGAHGFVNITAIVDQVKQNHHYVEADMRPTVWVDHGQYLGREDAKALQLMRYEMKSSSTEVIEDKVVIGYPVRMGPLQILFNQGQAWRQLEQEPFLWKILLRNWRHFLLACINMRKPRQFLRKHWMTRFKKQC